jgi:uncharacterized membrane protein YgcG
MQAIQRTERERMNLPLGMTELELIGYSPTVYELYRSEAWYDKDAFRFDPIVSTGMLASDFTYADTLAWVNLLTPESQMAVNPGDNLIVPVQTYDNYKQLPPWEKKLTHEVSYKGESGYSANLLNLQASKVGAKNGFVGDFSYYFDQESRMKSITPISEPITIAPTRSTTTTPTRSTTTTPTYTPMPTPTIVRGGTTAPSSSREDAGGEVFVDWSNASGTLEEVEAKLEKCREFMASARLLPGATPPCKILEDKIIELGGTTTTTDPSAVGLGGGGGGSFGGGGGSSEAPEEGQGEGEAKPTENKPATQKAATIKPDYKIIVIGIVLGVAMSYYIAKNRNKDIKQYGIIGAIIGGILGFVYSKHKQQPIEQLTKLGIK